MCYTLLTSLYRKLTYEQVKLNKFAPYIKNLFLISKLLGMTVNLMGEYFSVTMAYLPGEGCIGDMYLQLLPASSTANYSSMLDRRFPNVPQPPSKVPLPSNNFSNIHHQKGVPWSLHPSSKKILTDRHNIESESQNNGMSYNLRIRQRIRQRAPAPLPEQSASSQNKVEYIRQTYV